MFPQDCCHFYDPSDLHVTKHCVKILKEFVILNKGITKKKTKNKEIQTLSARKLVQHKCVCIFSLRHTHILTSFTSDVKQGSLTAPLQRLESLRSAAS